jgi:Sec-independent protein translocase protein TatA
MTITFTKLLIILVVFVLIFGTKPLIAVGKYLWKAGKGLQKDIENVNRKS